MTDLNVLQEHVDSSVFTGVLPSEQSCESEGEGTEICSNEDISNNESDSEQKIIHGAVEITKNSIRDGNARLNDGVLDQSDSTGVTQPHNDLQNIEQVEEAEGESNTHRKIKTKKKKKIAFYVKDARYDVVKRVGKREFEWRNTYKDEEECNIIWSDIGLQPERLQNMKPFQ